VDRGVRKVESFGEGCQGKLDVRVAEDGREDLALLARPEDRKQRRGGATRPSIHRLNYTSQSVEYESSRNFAVTPTLGACGV
jgi:hypothetical protein